MNTNPLSDQIEQLLKDKDVQALTPTEQQIVIRELGSLEAYARLRTIATRSQEVFSRESIVPSSAVLGSILTRVASHSAAPTTKTSWFMRPLPLYQVAAAMALCLLSMWWWTSSRMNPLQDPVVITLVDTVVQEIVRVDTILLETSTAPASYVQSIQPHKKARVKPTQLATNTISTKDYRFSRGDYPIASAPRSGPSLKDQATHFVLDSMPGMEHLFAADKVF